MKKFAVIGYPLGHTMSPFIHKKLFELSGIDATYEAFETHPDLLKDRVEFLKGYDGFNITIPHKETIINLIDSLGESAKIYNAVNTVCNKNGLLTGHSTDAAGFTSALQIEDIPLSGSVLILGSGGVARTIATECALHNCSVTFAVRDADLKRAKELAFDLKERFTTAADVISLEDVDGSYDIAVNGTPLGMYPNENSSALSREQMKNITYFFDAVYNPEETLFIKTARSLGKKAVSGMGMLVMQAANAHRYWYGAAFKNEDMKNLITLSNQEMRRLFDKK